MSGAGAVAAGAAGGKVKVDLGSLQGQANSMASVSSGRVSAYQGTIASYNNFSGAPGLQGVAYTAAKNFGQSVIVPYYQACILYVEAVADGCNRLVSLYTSMVGEESLDQAVLEAQIAEYDATIANTESAISASRKEQPDIFENRDLISLQKTLSFQQSERRKVQEKLDKLLAFAAASANVFEGANSLGDVAAQGGAAIQVSLNAGNYNIPSDMSWAATTQTNWAAREQAIVDNYERALAKVQNGEELTPEDATAIERYQAAYPDKVNQEAVKAAEAYRVESRYQAAVSKVNNGQELNNSDVKAIEAYQKAHPEVKIAQNVQKAKEAYAIEKNYQDVVAKAHRGEALTEEDIKTIEAYGGIKPDVSMDQKVVQGVKDFLNKVKNSYDENSTEVDMLANLIEQIGIGTQRIGGLVSLINGIKGPATTAADGVTSTSFVMLNSKSNSVGQAIVGKGSQIAKFGKGLGYGLVAIGFGLGMYDDIANNGKTVGQAVANNTISTGLGLAGASLTTVAVTAILGATPVGWAAVGTAALAFGVSTLLTSAYDAAYDSNFLGLQDGVDAVGKELDKVGSKIAEGAKNVGQAVSDTLNSINPLNWGW